MFRVAAQLLFQTVLFGVRWLWFVLWKQGVSDCRTALTNNNFLLFLIERWKFWCCLENRKFFPNTKLLYYTFTHVRSQIDYLQKKGQFLSLSHVKSLNKVVRYLGKTGFVLPIAYFDKCCMDFFSVKLVDISGVLKLYMRRIFLSLYTNIRVKHLKTKKKILIILFENA